MGLVGVGMKLGKTALNGFRANGMLRQGIENTFNGAVQAGKNILHSNEPMNAIKGLGNSMTAGAEKFSQGARNTAQNMMKQAGEKVNQAAARAGIPDLGASMQKAGDEIAKMGEGAYNYAKKVAPDTVKAVEDIGAAGKQLNEEAIENIGKKADALHLNRKGFEDLTSIGKEMVENAGTKASRVGSNVKDYVSGKGNSAKDYISGLGRDVKDNYKLYAKKALTADREDWGTKKFERLGMTVGDTSDEAIRNMSKSQLAKSMFMNNNGTISKSSVAIAGLGAVGVAGAGISAVTPSFKLDGSGKGKTGALIGASVGYSMGGHASDAFKGAALGYLAGR